MTPAFENGTKVRFNDNVVAMAPAYQGKVYTVIAASAAWEIGQRNEWYGDYVIVDEDGNKSVTSERCLVAEVPAACGTATDRSGNVWNITLYENRYVATHDYCPGIKGSFSGAVLADVVAMVEAANYRPAR